MIVESAPKRTDEIAAEVLGAHRGAGHRRPGYVLHLPQGARSHHPSSTHANLRFSSDGLGGGAGWDLPAAWGSTAITGT